MLNTLKIKFALKIAATHFVLCTVALSLCASMVFLVWYPDIYSRVRGGLNLMGILFIVDLVCGPALTFVMSSRSKPKHSLIIDLTLVAIIQILALGYGVWSLWVARPIFIVHEIDRLKIIGLNDLSAADRLMIPIELAPSLFSKPLLVGLRKPQNDAERNAVLVESVLGGRDYSERPNFYIPYDQAYGFSTAQKAKPMNAFLDKNPEKIVEVIPLLANNSELVSTIKYLPLANIKGDAVAVLDSKGIVLGYIYGNGF